MSEQKKAKNISEYWVRKEREKELAASSKITLEQLYQRIKEGAKELNVILKADVQGSLDAIIQAFAGRRRRIYTLMAFYFPRKGHQPWTSLWMHTVVCTAARARSRTSPSWETFSAGRP